ncbi:hypothetical protein [Tenacibaculum aiptasiae]|uniref:hypothetical protein n=1 Tax=Tenacibaculum aiptasiae TaxID=426481 RepID=UPI0015880554|nr:hypothetical protein [Tenacibaculum aiptasiae]
MKNLQNFGVQELNFKEINETNGGLIFFLFLKYGEQAGEYLELSGFNSAGANK